MSESEIIPLSELLRLDRLHACIRVDALYLDGTINKEDMTNWKIAAFNGKLTKEEIDNAILKRQNGYPLFNFFLHDTSQYMNDPYDTPE
jgi:hypothetical protein